MAEEKNNRKPTIGAKVLVAVLVFCINWSLSIPMYWIIMEMFDVDTSGFINLNDLFVPVVSWEIVALLGAVFSSIFKRKLHPYGTTIVNIQTVFFILPLFLLIVLIIFMLS